MVDDSWWPFGGLPTNLSKTIRDGDGKLHNVLIVASPRKRETIQLISRDKMGRFSTSRDSWVENFDDKGYAIYFRPDSGSLQSSAFDTASELISASPNARLSIDFGCNTCGLAGSTLSISASGSANGIDWTLNNRHYYNLRAALYAYPAGDLDDQLDNSKEARKGRDAPVPATRFSTPAIASGPLSLGHSVKGHCIRARAQGAICGNDIRTAGCGSKVEGVVTLSK